MYPSVGNWQQECRSHYWIENGRIIWADKWSPERILEGREHEERRRQAYFDERGRQRIGIIKRFWHWFICLFRN